MTEQLLARCEFYPHVQPLAEKPGEFDWAEAPDCVNCKGTNVVPAVSQSAGTATWAAPPSRIPMPNPIVDQIRQKVLERFPEDRAKRIAHAEIDAAMHTKRPKRPDDPRTFESREGDTP